MDMKKTLLSKVQNKDVTVLRIFLVNINNTTINILHETFFTT